MRTRSKAAKVTSTLRDAHDVQNVWQSIPTFAMGEVRLNDFNEAYDAAQELTKDYATN